MYNLRCTRQGQREKKHFALRRKGGDGESGRSCYSRDWDDEVQKYRTNQGCWRSCCCSCSQNFCMTSVARGRGRKKHHAQRYEGGGGESGQGCYSREGENSRARSSYSLDEDGSKRGQRHARAGRTGRVAVSTNLGKPKELKFGYLRCMIHSKTA